jgi:hypothetical protein
MAIVVTAQQPGGTAAEDEELREEIRNALGPGQNPASLLLRVAGPIPSGWQIISVWESQEAFDTFRLERLGPALQRLGRPMPSLQIWPVETVFPPRQGRA